VLGDRRHGVTKHAHRDSRSPTTRPRRPPLDALDRRIGGIPPRLTGIRHYRAVVGGDDLDRERQNLRRSFDTDAESYERTRPVLPDALFDDLCEAATLTRGSRVIEIGCGTGQATLPLARRGLNITALEIGPQLAALARQKLADFPSVSVMTSSFEDWKASDSSVDAVVAVNSLLWVNPDAQFTKPARLLRRGGTMAVASCRWVAPEDPDPFLEAVQEDYRAVGYPGARHHRRTGLSPGTFRPTLVGDSAKS